MCLFWVRGRQCKRDSNPNTRGIGLSGAMRAKTAGLLLKVAKHLFAEQGIAATTMKQFASAAGVGKGAFYRYFADKGELGRTTF
jgi:AcrR family transcriptional regulator